MDAIVHATGGLPHAGKEFLPARTQVCPGINGAANTSEEADW
jgi:hypothetical protein